MAQTLLTEIQEFCERSLLPVPVTVIGNPDPQVIQIKALLYEAGNAIAVRGEWARLTHETVHTTVAQEDQGNIFAITAGSEQNTAFRKMKEDTVWDRSDKLPVWPINAIAWQRIKATVNALPRFRFRVLRHRLLLTPSPPAGHQLAFEWVSKWWIQNNVGTIKERFSADSDTFLLERELIKLSLRWRWKKEKGYDYAEDYEEYETRLSEMLGHDVPRPTLQLDSSEPSVRPGVFVPEYSWTP